MNDPGWRTTIQSGDAAADFRTLEQHRASANARGLVLHVKNLPNGGFEVAATPAGVASPLETGYGSFAAPVPAPRFAPAPYPPYGAYAPLPAPAAAVPPMRRGGDGMCQACGRDADVKHLTFRQNIGALIIRFPKTITGFLCRHCVEKHFWTMTGITLLGGWWGYISFAYSLFAIPANVYNYLSALGLTPPPDDLRSLGEKKTRSIFMIVFGVLLGLLGGLWMLVSLSLLLSPDPDDVAAGVFNLVVSLIAVLPALALFVFGIMKRVKASAKERELLGTR